MKDVPQILSKALEDRTIEVAVLCIEGCGTSIVNDPSVIGKIAERITGSGETAPDQSVIDVVDPKNVLDPEDAKVDNIEGVCVAYDNGLHMVAVTTGSLDDAQVMRDMFGSDLYIIGMFDTLSNDDLNRACELLDIISTGSGVEIVTEFGKQLAG